MAFWLPRPPFGGRQMPCFRAYRSFLSSDFGAAEHVLQYFTIANKEQTFEMCGLPVAFYEHLCYNYYAEKTDSAFRKTIKNGSVKELALPYTCAGELAPTQRTSSAPQEPVYLFLRKEARGTLRLAVKYRQFVFSDTV